MKNSEVDKWSEARMMQIGDKVTLGSHSSFQLTKTPRRVLFSLSRYKFAAKMIGNGKTILEVGCNDGLGSSILAEFAEKYIGVDIDEEAITEAIITFGEKERVKFETINFLGSDIGKFNSIVSFDVIEHIFPENEVQFFESVCRNLEPYGLFIVGTPNLDADIYSSEHSKSGHVNMYDWKKLKETMDRYFSRSFIFSANDEIIHTGFYPMAHYLIAVGVL